MVPKKKVTKDKNSKKSEIKKNIIKKTQLKNQTFVCLLCKFTLASEATGAPVGHAKQELPHRANPLASDILHDHKTSGKSDDEADTDHDVGDDVSILWCGPQPSRGRCLSAAAAPASSPPPPSTAS